MAAEEFSGADAEEPLRTRIDRGYAALWIKPDDAGRNVSQERFGVTAAPFEFGARGAQIRGHPVERAHQVADLVVADRRNFVTEIAGGDLLGALGQQFDRTRNSAREVDSEPAGQEHHRQADQDQRYDVAVHDRLMENAELEILLESVRNAGRLCRKTLGQVIVDDDRTG